MSNGSFSVPFSISTIEVLKYSFEKVGYLKFSLPEAAGGLMVRIDVGIAGATLVGSYSLWTSRCVVLFLGES